MNVVAFSLWGESKLYCQGALDNIPLVKKYYPSWMPRFYVAENCPALKDLEQEAKIGNCQIEIMPPSDFHWGSTCGKDHQHPSHCNMAWRYQAAFDRKVEKVIFRDCDSRCSEREASAVQEWIESGLDGHAIYERDVHWNNGGVMPGCAGVKTRFFQSLTLESYQKLAGDFLRWYQTKGYEQGYRNVHMDIHHYRFFFFDPLLRINQIFFSGHRTNNPLKVSVGEYGEVGSTYQESWRYQNY